MKNLNYTDLNPDELHRITGGSSSAPSTIWYNIGYIAGIVAQGLIVFGREGGRNAGLSIK
ncbi:hypothetical protein D9M68_595690 [compost metagenome]